MMTSIWNQINTSAATAVETVRDSLVQIVGTQGNMGAGTIWQSDGLILTNAHVVVDQQPRRDLTVVLQGGTRYIPQLLAYDRQRDIAALSINAKNLPTIAIGNSRDLTPGQYLMAIGHPWGVLDAITGGVVIGTGDKLPEVGDKRDWIALDMKMRPGHSGGPLFDSEGRIVGINTMIRGPEVSFAVPVDVVKKFLKDALGNWTPAQAASLAENSDDVVIV